ncbi:hypothetical protein B0A80_09760 [Flavobacterium tructae]|nr:hypothetical protein B0A80_09760 [Flavobacterium tructae]
MSIGVRVLKAGRIHPNRKIKLFSKKILLTTKNTKKMKDSKPKCNCAKNGVMCALKMSLIKQGASVADTTAKSKAVCPLKAAIFSSAS